MIVIIFDRDREFAMSTAQPLEPASGLRERNKQDKLRRIVAAAAERFAAAGFEATSAREISRRAGIGTGTLFTYVRDKRELLFLVFEADALRLLAEAEAAAARRRGVVGALLALFGPFIDFYATRPELSRLFARELFFRRPEETHGMEALSWRLARAVTDVLARGVERGELRADLPLGVAAGAVLAQYSFWIQRWLGAEAVAHEAVPRGLRAGLELLLDGMRAEEGADGS
jgi:AcrR family transcriptional regulator